MDRERLLNKTSDNIAQLIQLMTIHEENLSRYARGLDIDIRVLSLLTPDISGNNLNHLTQCTYENIINPMNDECSITHETFQPTDEVAMINRCRHIFKKNALLNWLSITNNCPLCRITLP